MEIRGMDKVLALNCLHYSFRKKKNYLDFGTCGIKGGKNFLFNIESYIYTYIYIYIYIYFVIGNCVCVCVCE